MHPPKRPPNGFNSNFSWLPPKPSDWTDQQRSWWVAQVQVNASLKLIFDVFWVIDLFQNWSVFWFTTLSSLRCITSMYRHTLAMIRSRKNPDFMRCLRDELQPALDDKFICQRVKNADDLFIPVLLGVIYTSRNWNTYWFLHLIWLCKMDMI